MSSISAIKSLIDPILIQHDVLCYECKWTNEGKMRILQVAIMRNDGSMDLETCQTVSNAISDALDANDVIPSEYYLEVCSAGAERELRSDAEIAAVIGTHVFVRFVKPIDKKMDITGELLSFEDGLLIIAYRDKQKKVKITVEKSNISLIRLAVAL
jgi:ribosome maturation factor RimP